MTQYQNGNTTIRLLQNGTRYISFEDSIDLVQPLNIDIRVNTSCSFADNVCKDFCHESAVRNGKECDYNALQERLKGLTPGIEIAIGCNEFTTGLYNFLSWCYDQGYVCNITINQGHLQRDKLMISAAINHNYIKGIGVSYRSSLKWNVPQFILDYQNTIFHTIVGIDNIDDVLSLSYLGVKKLTVLGCKDFGYNTGKVNLSSIQHREWYWWVHKLFSRFGVVSFDNLALQQLNIQRFFPKEKWDTFYQDEWSLYINAVEQYFSPSSRSHQKTSWNDTTVTKYFRSLNKQPNNHEEDSIKGNREVLRTL